MVASAGGAAAQTDPKPVPQPVIDILGPAVSFTLGGVAFVLVFLVLIMMVLAIRSQSIYRDMIKDKFRVFEVALKQGNTGIIQSGAMDLEAPPMALPEGSVRAMIAVTIVLISLAFVVIYMGGRALGLPEFGLPEIIATVLGTVLGFYFGTRGSAETKAVLRQATAQAQESQRASRDVVDRALERSFDRLPASTSSTTVEVQVQAPDPAVFETVRTNARSLVTAARAVSELLPEDQGQRLKQTVGAASTALDLVEQLLGENKEAEAFERARVAQDAAQRSFVDLVQDAVDGVAPIVGGLVPGGTLILGLIRVGAGLSGQAYERWRNEILSAPHSPELFPPTAVSADVAMPLMRKVETLAELFSEELARGDRAFVTEFKDGALAEDGPSALAERFSGRNADVDADEIEAAVHAFRGLVRQDLLLREIPGELLPRGEIETIVGAVDRMAEGEEEDGTLAAGLAQVHKIVLIVDKLNELGVTGQLLDLAQRTVAAKPQPEAAV